MVIAPGTGRSLAPGLGLCHFAGVSPAGLRRLPHRQEVSRLWQNLHWPAWLQPPKMLTELIKKKQTPRPAAAAPGDAADVCERRARPRPPPNRPRTPSSTRTRTRAPPIPSRTRSPSIPKIDGKQTEVAKTEDVPREKFIPLQPASAPPLQPPQEAQPEIKPKPRRHPRRSDPGQTVPDAPQGRGRCQRGQTRPPAHRQGGAGAAAEQPLARREDEAGRRGAAPALEIASLDTKATPFGAYDAALVEAISQRWFTLLDEREYASDSRGKVVLQFRLHYDGRVTDMNVAENTAGEVLGSDLPEGGARPGAVCGLAERHAPHAGRTRGTSSSPFTIIDYVWNLLFTSCSL